MLTATAHPLSPYDAAASKKGRSAESIPAALDPRRATVDVERVQLPAHPESDPRDPGPGELSAR